ncbi:MAG: HlyD family efflux transporter periplasmic adaptor subunit [Cyanobacteria bacterium J06607_13]
MTQLGKNISENPSRNPIENNRIGTQEHAHETVQENVSELRLQPKTDEAIANNGKRKFVPRRLPRWLLYGLAGCGAFVLLALAFRPAPIPVDIGEVTQGPLQITVDAEGKTQVEERYVIAAPVDGRLQRIDLEAGDSVSANAIVAQLDPLPLNTQVREAQSRLQQLQAEASGVETQRPKSQELEQAEARLRAAQADAQAAQAAVTEAQADLEQARRDRIRAQELAAAGAIARQAQEAAELTETQQAQALETAQQQRQSAIATVAAEEENIPILREQQRDPDYLVDAYQAQIAGVEAELANLADEAKRTTIAAPVSGTVLRVPEASARFVQAGDPLIEVGDAAQLELVIDVLSADAVKIDPGDEILIEQWGGEATLRGTVAYIEPSAFTETSALGVEEQRVNVIGNFAPAAQPAEQTGQTVSDRPLGDGYRIEARIVIWEDSNVLQVPVSALYRCDQAWCVFKINEDQAEPVEVEIGQRNPMVAAVEAGLALGDRVILHPSEQIEAGQKVAPR